jgi:hypothetical protein
LRAGGVEADRAVARAMAGMDDLEIVEPVTRLEHQRCLLGDDQHVQRAEEIEIVAIDEQFLRGRERFGQGGQIVRPAAFDPQRMEGQVAVQPAPRQTDHLGLDARVGRREDDLQIGRMVGQRQRDRQAVRDLVDLVMIEEKTNPHARKTPPRRPSRIQSYGLIGRIGDAFVTGVGVAVRGEGG